MQNDEYTPDVELDANEINTVEETTEQEVETTNQPADVDWKAEALKWQAIAKRKSQQVATAPQKNITNNNPELSEELKLIARGLTDEEIDQAKVVAKGKGIALTEAIKDPLFVIYQNDLKEKQRKEDAKLGTSKGSQQAPDKTITGIEAGSSREAHMEAFKKIMGN